MISFAAHLNHIPALTFNRIGDRITIPKPGTKCSYSSNHVLHMSKDVEVHPSVSLRYQPDESLVRISSSVTPRTLVKLQSTRFMVNISPSEAQLVAG